MAGRHRIAFGPQQKPIVNNRQLDLGADKWQTLASYAVEKAALRKSLAWAAFLLLLVASTAHAQRRSDFTAARRRMINDEIIAAGVKDERVTEAIMQTPRHEFVLPKYRRLAYFDMALPIGAEQTISSPFIVSYMTESLDPQLTDKVLEIGTGSGYQAAVLSPLVDQVYTIEIVESLGRRARKLLKRLKYENVHVRIGDGYKGWPEEAPFDKIVVTCSPESVPQPLVDQLREGGRMVVPVGERYQQTLYMFTKKNGALKKEALRPTLFVPMTGAAEESRNVKPDPLNPVAINGDFEDASEKGGIVPGWYYGRQVKLASSSQTPEGRYFAQFENQDDGRGSRLLQGFAIDGSKISRLRLATWFQSENVRPSSDDRLPAAMVTFYDQHRRELGQHWLGPWRGTHPWREYEKTIRVPREAREGILRIGLFGAKGKAAFDDVRIGRL